ncbi:MAG: hypothetical protein IKJ63_01100 [Clostridia bacterium]|nr:hypothetical protein [Clostridia bacterium]
MIIVCRRLGMSVFCLFLALCMAGCGISADGPLDPDKIVPARAMLIENLEDSGYAITTYTSVECSDLIIDRVVARKGNRFIDIAYGLTAEDAESIFDCYCTLYPDDYYILACNGNYVYCVSDKTTFSKAGFTSTLNIGEQYIHD